MAGCFWGFSFGTLLLGCDQNEVAPAEVKEALPPRGPKSEQQSPNARILPEPLEEPGKLSETEDGVDDDPPEIPRPRPKPGRWPLSTMLSEEPLKGNVGGGYIAQARIVWPEAERHKMHNRVDYELWPLFRIELVRETRDRPALIRWSMASPVFPLPSGTELRSRVDRLGMVMVWPDQRSYRVVQAGALRAVFQDRRVDKTPFVEAIHTDSGVGSRLGQTSTRMKLVTALGVAHLEFIDVADLPYGGPLLCRQLLEFLRVQGKAEICKKQSLPIRMYVEWEKGGQFLFEVTELVPATDLVISNFRTPPHLPIFKRGELPPFETHIFAPEVRPSMLPLKKPGEPLAPEPTRPPPDPLAPPPNEEPDPSTLLPADAMVFRNLTHRPLLVILQKTPAFWLFPGQQERLRVLAGPMHVVARDFLGQVVLDQGLVAAPREVRFSTGAPSHTSSPP